VPTAILEQSGEMYGSLQALILHSHNRGACGGSTFETMDLTVSKISRQEAGADQMTIGVWCEAPQLTYVVDLELERGGSQAVPGVTFEAGAVAYLIVAPSSGLTSEYLGLYFEAAIFFFCFRSVPRRCASEISPSAGRCYDLLPTLLALVIISPFPSISPHLIIYLPSISISCSDCQHVVLEINQSCM
jgi:hypothetical protein